jgi:hypothetical protein
LTCLVAIASSAGCQKHVATCETNESLREAASSEARELFAADQRDRERRSISADRDRARRLRIAGLMADHCLTTAADFRAAAMIFQHGEAPEHFFQAYLWARRATEMGDAFAKQLVALTIDRYLVSIGHKQLFGSQMRPVEGEPGCLCVADTESDFPDALRKEYLQTTFAEELTTALQDSAAKCGGPCAGSLIPNPKGSVPGLW